MAITKITTATDAIPYPRVPVTPEDELDDAELTALTDEVVVDTVEVPEDDDVVGVPDASRLAGQLSPHMSFTSLQPRLSWPHWGSVAVGAQFPVSMPPVSMVWPLSSYVVAAYPEAENVILGADEASVVGVHPFR